MEVKWKDKNLEYLNSIDAFLDKASNIKDEDLRNDVIGAALNCEKILTNLAIKEISKNNLGQNCK